MSTQHTQVQSAGSRRFVWTVLAFALANAAVWVTYFTIQHRSAATSPTPALAVERFSPGDTKTVGPRQPLTWTLSADVGPAQPALIAEAPGVMTPNVAGKWAWIDRRTLTFTPDADYPKATRFTVTLLSQKFTPPAGTAAMPQPFVATVQTPALTVMKVRHAGMLNNEPLLELWFNDVVLAGDVIKHVSVAGPDGKERRVQLHGKADGKVVRVRCDDPAVPSNAAPAGEQSFVVAVKPGLAGTSGPLGLETKASFTVPISAQLMATGATAEASSRTESEIHLSFNGPLEPETLQKVLSIDPAIPFTVNRRWGNDLTVRAAFTPGTRYSLKLAEPPAGGGNQYPKGSTLSVFVPDRPPSVWVDQHEGYLGSRGNRSLMAHAVNVPAIRVTIIRVYDNTIVAWRNEAKRSRYGRDDSGAFSRPVVSKRIELAAAPKNQLQDIRLSLDELLPESFRGDGVYKITVDSESAGASPREFDSDDEDFPADRDKWLRGALVTLSDIGLSSKVGRDGVVSVWAVSLSSGRPINNVRVRLFSTKSQVLSEATTGDDGLATLSKVAPAPGEQPAVLIADTTTGAQLTWLDLRTSQTSFADADVGGREFLRSGYEAFVYTDRGVYRPGETVHLRAILRGAGQSVPRPFPVKWQLQRPDLRDWKSEVITLDADGGAGMTLALPADLPTGRWTAKIGLPGETRGAGANLGSVSFQVEEYIPERIKSSLGITAAGKPAQRVQLSEKQMKAALQADYLFGRPAAGLKAELIAKLTPARFEAPAWRGWTFGDTADAAQVLRGESPPLNRRVDAVEATTDDNGQANWPVDLVKLHAAEKDAYRGPWELTLVAGVREEGGRAVVAQQNVAVDNTPHYLGLRAAETSPRARTATTVSIAAVTPAGIASAIDLTVTAQLYIEQWNSVLLYEEGRYRYQSTRKLEPSGDRKEVRLISGKGQVDLTPPRGGRYVLVVSDAAARIESSIAFYAIEPAWQENISRESPEKIDLVLLPPVSSAPYTHFIKAIGEPKSIGAIGNASRSLITAMAQAADAANLPEKPPAFTVGQQARLLVRSPFAGQMLVCVETDRVVSRQVIEMTGSQMLVPIEVTDACRPGAFVSATVIRAVDPNAKWRAHRAFGVVRLPLDPADRRLNIAIDVPQETRPEQTLSASIRITDESGKPVSNAAVTVAAIDEGILQLTRFKTPDPLAFFLAQRALGVKSADLYSLLMPEVPKPREQAAVGGDDEVRGRVFGSGGNPRRNPISARRVKSVALFSGVVHTDSAGVAHADFPVPQFSGRLRLMAVACSGGGSDVSRFGSNAAETVVRSPLLVQTSLPRFATPGDRFVMPLTIFNNSSSAGTAKIRVTIDGTNGAVAPMNFVEGNPATVELPHIALAAAGQASRSIELTAGPGVGVARIKLTATMDGETFNETVELLVRPPSPEMTQGGFVAAKPDAPAKIAPPEDVLPGTRRLQVRVTPWPNLGLSRGLQYLGRYPYGCAEQTLSTAFPLVYLGDVGQKLAPGMFDRERIADKLQAGIIRLMSMQTHDGGIAMWPGGGDAWPWASVYAAHFLIEAQYAGHAVPEEFREHLLRYCRTLLEQGGDDAALIEQQAYACYVLSLAGKPPRATMSRLNEVLSAKAAAQSSARWNLALAWASAGRRDQAQALLPGFLPMQADSRQLGGNLGSRLRDRAMNLQAIVAIDPARPEIAAIAADVAGMLDNNRYLGTQETAVALCALGRYLKVAKKPAAYDGVELWAGDTKLASAEAGKELSWDLPAEKPLPKDLHVRVNGKPDCQAFVSWLQAGVSIERPRDASMGDLQVTRRYLDTAGKQVAWNQIKSGDLIRVELEVQSKQGVANVVIEDLLPAGLEVENPRLQSGAAAAVAANDAADKQEPNAFSVAHTDFRDDRVSVMGSFSSGGKGKASYLVRAVTPGTYVVPPVRAECMYDAGIHSIWTGVETIKVNSGDAKGVVMR